jgi:hypothetical protein
MLTLALIESASELSPAIIAFNNWSNGKEESKSKKNQLFR